MRKIAFAFVLATLWLPLSLEAAVWQVMVSDFQFTPAQLTIQQGDTVYWSNMGGFHNVRHTCEPSVFGNEPALNPWNYSFVFKVSVGSYPYVCEVHPDMMQGMITVTPKGRWDVTVRNFSFTPANLVITQGDTVVWTNVQGTHNVYHNATPSLFGNGIASAPWTYSFVFSLPPDSFPYICQVHPSSMRGSVKVLAPMSLGVPVVVAMEEAGQVRLDWEPICGAAQYQVYRSQDASETPFLTLVGTTSEPTYNELVDPGVNSRFFYQVRAVTP